MAEGQAGHQPGLEGSHSTIGKGAKFRGPSEEIERVLQVQKNYYAILKVSTSSNKEDIAGNYRRLMEILGSEAAIAHSKESAADAQALANEAHRTLTNSLKRSLYNRFLEEQQSGPESGQPYEEWEAAQASNPPQVPQWANRILEVPGGGLLLLCLCFPLTLVFFILLLVLLLILLPVKWLIGCLAGGNSTESSTKSTATGSVAV